MDRHLTKSIEAKLTGDRRHEPGLREGEEVFFKFRNHRFFAGDMHTP
jgi:hypothetical protein